MVSSLTGGSILKKNKVKERNKRINGRTTLSTKTSDITKKLIPKDIKKDISTVDEHLSSNRPLKDSNSQKLTEILSHHFEELQCTTQDRCKKEMKICAEEAFRAASTDPIDVTFQRMEQEIKKAQLDCTFITRQEEVLQNALNNLSTCLETYIQENNRIQAEIQALLIPSDPFELSDDIWGDAEGLLGKADAITKTYLHQMREAMQKCNDLDRENKRKLMHQLL